MAHTPGGVVSEPGVAVELVKTAVPKLIAYCSANDWAGHDPYDALNSALFRVRFLNSKWPRIILTQAMKRSPIDVRRLALVPKTQNPKAIALFLNAFLNLAKTGMPGAENLVDQMVVRLVALRSQGIAYWCWGYSFPWQTRTSVVPRGAPNLVCTTFVANALLDLYERRGRPEHLEMAAGAAEYMLAELYRARPGLAAGFAYPLPSAGSHVHNANFLGAALFARVHRITGDPKFLGPALRVARHATSAQRADGSWVYGEAPTQQWIDNFHTGYNLCALRSIGYTLNTDEFEPALNRGFAFYRASFFRKDGAARYFHNRTYPIDIHSIAQSLVTLVTLRDLDPASMALASSVLEWSMAHMWDDRGFFYYRVLKLGTIRTSYMRWSQAWMLLALSTLLAVPAVGAVSPPSVPELARA